MDIIYHGARCHQENIKVHSNQCRHVEWGSVDSDIPNMIMITRVAQMIADRLHDTSVKL